MYNCKDYTLTALRAIYKESIIRTLKGLLLSLLLHLLILMLFITNWKEITFLPPKKEDKKISLNLQQIVTPPPAKPKPVPVPKPVVTPPTPKPIVDNPKEEVQPLKKKVVDKPKKVFAQKSSEENNVTKTVPKPLKKIVKKEEKKKTVKKVQKKRVVKKTKPYRKPRRSSDPLANALMGSGTSMFPTQRSRPSSSGSYGARMINQLYGEEFNTYSETQKKFIKNNLGTIHTITQRTLTRNGYPEVAVRTRQQGTNVVSFYLHPNGDISDLKLKKHIGHQALDQNTLEVIRIAYKDYPLPNKKTKIVFYVKYSIY
jgi:TonB family protein